MTLRWRRGGHRDCHVDRLGARRGQRLGVRDVRARARRRRFHLRRLIHDVRRAHLRRKRAAWCAFERADAPRELVDHPLGVHESRLQGVDFRAEFPALASLLRREERKLKR